MEINELKKIDDKIARVELAKKYISTNIVSLWDENFVSIAYDVYDHENAPKGLKMLKEEGAKGNAYALLTLAELYMFGNCNDDKILFVNMPVDMDLDLAKYYYNQVLPHDSSYFASIALNHLGDFALTGNPHYSNKNVRNIKNIDKAIEFYTKSAKLGSVSAQMTLIGYYSGIPISYDKFLIEPNPKAAFYWMYNSFEENQYAAWDVGRRFLYGVRVKQDFKKAAEAFKYGFPKEGEISSYINMFSAEYYAGMCQLGLIEGKSVKDAEEIRARYDQDRLQSMIYNFYSIYKKGPLADDGLFNYWKNFQVDAPEKPQEPKYLTTRMQNIEKLDALPNANEPKMQYIRGLAYKIAVANTEGLNSADYPEVLEKAKTLIKSAAEAEYFPAMFSLADKWFFDKNESESLKWLEKIDKIDHGKATRLILSEAHFQNSEEMLKATKAMSAEDFSRISWILVNYINSKGLNEETFPVLDAAIKLSINCDLTIHYALAKILGIGMEKDIEGGIALLEKLTNTQYFSEGSSFLLAYLYSGKLGVKADAQKYEKYDKLYKSISSMNTYSIFNADSISRLLSNNAISNDIIMFSKSLNADVKSVSESSYEQSWAFFNLASETLQEMANMGNEHAKYALALKYIDRYSKEKDEKKSADLFKELHETDPKNVKYLAGICYLTFEGLGGIEQDKAKAKEILAQIFAKAEANDKNALDVVANFVSTNYSGQLRIKTPIEILDMVADFYNKPGKGDEYVLTRLAEKYIDNEQSEKGLAMLVALSEKGFSSAALELGRYYRRSKSRDYAKALKYYERAAETRKGSLWFANEYAMFYFYGRGTEKDYKKAFEILSLESDPNAYKYIWLCVFYEMGYGVEKNPELAQEYFDRALMFEKSKNSDPGRELGWAGEHLMTGNGTNHYEFPKIPELGYRLIKAGAELGAADANRRMAEILIEGKFEPANHEKAAEHYLDFANKRGIDDDFWGCADAIRIYKYSPMAKNPEKAFALATSWIEQNPKSSWGLANLAALHLYGIGTPKDEAKAFELIEKAAALPVNEAYGDLIFTLQALCYQNGYGTPKDEAKALEIADKVASIKWSRCGVSLHAYNIALNFKEGQNPFDLPDYLGFTPEKEKVDFWMDMCIKGGKQNSNKKMRKYAFERVRDFYKAEGAYKNDAKVAEIEKLIDENK